MKKVSPKTWLYQRKAMSIKANTVIQSRPLYLTARTIGTLIAYQIKP